MNRNTISDFEVQLYVWNKQKLNWIKRKVFKRTPAELLSPAECEKYILYGVTFTCSFVSVFVIKREEGEIL